MPQQKVTTNGSDAVNGVVGQQTIAQGLAEAHRDIIAACADKIMHGKDLLAEVAARGYVGERTINLSPDDGIVTPNALEHERNVAFERNVRKLMTASTRKACTNLEESQTQTDAVRAGEIRQRYGLVPRDNQGK